MTGLLPAPLTLALCVCLAPLPHRPAIEPRVDPLSPEARALAGQAAAFREQLQARREEYLAGRRSSRPRGPPYRAPYRFTPRFTPAIIPARSRPNLLACHHFQGG
jgi:hypothetical protein